MQEESYSPLSMFAKLKTYAAEQRSATKYRFLNGGVIAQDGQGYFRINLGRLQAFTK